MEETLRPSLARKCGADRLNLFLYRNRLEWTVTQNGGTQTSRDEKHFLARSWTRTVAKVWTSQKMCDPVQSHGRDREVSLVATCSTAP